MLAACEGAVDGVVNVSRRRFVAGVGGALALPGALSGAVRGGSFPDLNDPADNLRAFVKLIGALDADPVYDLIRGSVYALIAGRPAQPLFKTLGAGVATFQRVSAREYLSTSRYVGLLLDWQSEQPLQRWKNPLNGAQCEVPTTRYGPGDSRVLGGRILPAGGAVDTTATTIWPWFRLGDVVHMQRAVLQEEATHPLFPKADLLTYSGDWHQLADPTIKRMPSRLNFSAVESWRTWMRMEPSDPPGTLWWHVSGVKLDSADSYPPSIREMVTRAAPDFFAS